MFFSIMVYHTVLNRVPCWGSRALWFSHSTCKSWHSLTPNSPLFPPPFSLALGDRQSVLYVNLFLLYRHVHLCHILDSTYKWYHMVFVWFASNVIISGSIHIAADSIVWFFLVANIPSRVFFEKDLWNSPWTMSHPHSSCLHWPGPQDQDDLLASQLTSLGVSPHSCSHPLVSFVSFEFLISAMVLSFQTPENTPPLSKLFPLQQQCSPIK